MHRSKQHLYSITSSVRAISVSGDNEAKCLGGPEIDDQLEFGRQHNQQVGRARGDDLDTDGGAVTMWPLR